MRVASHISLAAVASLASVVAISILGCPDESKTPMGPMTPAGPGYDNLRTLSREDCTSLRDHQIEIAVEAALAPDGGTESLDAGDKYLLEAQLRLREKPVTDAWIKRCTGRMIPAIALRCMREATTPEAFNACDGQDDAGMDATDARDAIVSDAAPE